MKTRTSLLFLGDALMLIASFFITLYVGFLGDVDLVLIQQQITPFILLYVCWLILVFIFNFYDLKSIAPTFTNIERTGGLILVLLVVSTVFFYTIPVFGISPKTNLLINVIVFGGLWIIWRRLFYSIVLRSFKQQTILIGSTSITQQLYNHIQQSPQYGITITDHVPSLSDAQQLLRKKSTNLIIIESLQTFPKELLPRIFAMRANIISVADAYEKFVARIPVECIDETWFVNKITGSYNTLYEWIKRCTSVFVASVVLLVTLPFCIIISIAIKLHDGGPLFIRQERMGKNNKPFMLYKFRSMKALDPDGQAEGGSAQWAQKNDPRITKVGKIIRKLHVDELPQLWNVLRGDITLVGPRPERPELVTELESQIPHYHLRHVITPGFTGWAQIKFRYARTVMDAKEKFEYDLYYLKNRNVFLDLGIIIKTIQIIFTH